LKSLSTGIIPKIRGGNKIRIDFVGLLCVEKVVFEKTASRKSKFKRKKV